MACFAFYVLFVQNLDRSSALYRCVAGEGAGLKSLTSFLCCVGLAALATKFFGIVVQFGGLEREHLSERASDIQPVADATNLLAQLESASAAARIGYLPQRLLRALEFVRQKGSADALEHQLHYLAEADRRQMSSGYASTRLIAGAIGAVGVLGVVTGASIAVAGMSTPGAAATTTSIAAGVQLSLATAAQALGAAMILLFAKYGVERTESRLLAAIDQTANQQLLGRFRQYGSDHDPQVASVALMCEKLLATVETAITRQDAAVTKSVTTAGRRWDEAASTAAALLHRTIGEALAAGLKAHAQTLNDGVAKHTADLQGTLIRHAEILSEGLDQHTGALADALEHHTAVMTETEKTLTAENRRHLGEVEAALGESALLAVSRQERLIQQSENLLKDMQQALLESAGTTIAQQEQLIRQSDVLLRIVEATGQVRRLEEALNANLSSLATSHHFEQTMVGLSAALQLLSANLGRPLSIRGEIDLDCDDTTSQAA